MLEIKYNFSNSLCLDEGDIDEGALRYDLFLGSLILKEGDNSIVMDWDWIPLIDFAFCLYEICKNMSNKTEIQQEFEFTESDEKLFFEKKEDKLKLTASFSEIAIEISYEDFQIAIEKFVKDIIFEISSRNPKLNGNIIFSKYLKIAEHISMMGNEDAPVNKTKQYKHID